MIYRNAACGQCSFIRPGSVLCNVKDSAIGCKDGACTSLWTLRALRLFLGKCHHDPCFISDRSEAFNKKSTTTANISTYFSNDGKLFV